MTVVSVPYRCPDLGSMPEVRECRRNIHLNRAVSLEGSGDQEAIAKRGQMTDEPILPSIPGMAMTLRPSPNGVNGAHMSGMRGHRAEGSRASSLERD